ncbi:MAG: beta-galactosidase [Patescibacteria group bacterium]|jgi:hypothetical protein
MLLTFLAVACAVFLVVLGFLLTDSPQRNREVDFGMTFSRPYARDELGLDADRVLTASLDELGIRRFRIGAYWNFIEPQKGDWNFDDLDRDIREIEARGGSIVLAVGQKLPRWPECWAPEWSKQLSSSDREAATLQYIETVVTRYRENKTIIAWQIENEPHFEYGECPKTDPAFHAQEVDLVRSLDGTRPVVTTDSGELSLWTTFGRSVDALGISVYRVVQNPTIGIWRYWFIPPSFYRRKAQILQPFGVHTIYVSEFQMEPWSNKPLPQTPVEDQMKTFNLAQMKKNIAYAKRMGISPIDFWGVEWWYWMKEKREHPEFWEMAKTIYQK